MTVQVRRFTPEEWYRYAEEAHKLVFDTHRDPWIDRISYALMAYDDSGVIGYVTCRDLDCASVYWQYGGALKEKRGMAAYRGFEAFLNQAKEKYRRVTTCVENNNVGYLHLLMKSGFRVIGIRCYDGKVYLELILHIGD